MHGLVIHVFALDGQAERQNWSPDVCWLARLAQLVSSKPMIDSISEVDIFLRKISVVALWPPHILAHMCTSTHIHTCACAPTNIQMQIHTCTKKGKSDDRLVHCDFQPTTKL